MPATRSGKTKATMERALIAERVLNEARMTGKKLAKERMYEFGELFTAVAGHFQKAIWSKIQQPASANEQWSEFEKMALSEFRRWLLDAFEVEKELAKYQSPTFRAVAVVETNEQQRRFAGNAVDVLRRQIEATVLASEIIETVAEDGNGEATDDVPVLVSGNGKSSS